MPASADAPPLREAIVVPETTWRAFRNTSDPTIRRGMEIGARWFTEHPDADLTDEIGSCMADPVASTALAAYCVGQIDGHRVGLAACLADAGVTLRVDALQRLEQFSPRLTACWIAAWFSDPMPDGVGG